jgi:chemotaxis protein CheZ
MTAASAAPSVSKRLESLRATHGETVQVRDVADVVNSMVSTMQGELEIAAKRIGSELGELLSFIESAKREIAEIRPNTLSKRDIPGAADELDAIVQHTEVAAGAIMDAADEISAIAGSMTGEDAERLNAVATKIFEASSFQDITGQRVTKVVRVLKHIEEKLGKLASAVGDVHVEEKAVERRDDGVPVDHKDLLNGPQLEGAGNNQDDIDALLASFD